MSLTIQTITVTGASERTIVATLPAQHVYPFIIHRSIDEYHEKVAGERTRYTKKHCVTHLLTGANVGVFSSYENALTFVRKIKNKPIFLMPTFDLLTTHPDMADVGVVVNELKRLYAID